jgi:hypothetical protein
MSQRNPFKLFVSHLWQDQDDYFRVFEYLESTTNFYYLNYSKPAQKPAGTKEDLKAELRRQIEPAETVIILSSMYEDFREWIEFEVNAAQAMNKPLIVMERFGTGDVPDWLRDRADEIGEWNHRSIEDAVRRTARHEDTNRWEVIEFDWPTEEGKD